MENWILWIIVVSIMISIIIGSGGCGYSPATGVLDTTFDGDGIVVYN